MTTTCRTSGTASKTKRTCRNNLCKNTEAFEPSRRGRVPGGAFPDARAAGGDGCTIEPGAGPAFSVEGRGPRPAPALRKGESRWTSARSFARTAGPCWKRGPKAAPTASAALPAATPPGPCRWAPCWPAATRWARC